MFQSAKAKDRGSLIVWYGEREEGLKRGVHTVSMSLRILRASTTFTARHAFQLGLSPPVQHPKFPIDASRSALLRIAFGKDVVVYLRSPKLGC